LRFFPAEPAAFVSTENKPKAVAAAAAAEKQ